MQWRRLCWGVVLFGLVYGEKMPVAQAAPLEVTLSSSSSGAFVHVRIKRRRFRRARAQSWSFVVRAWVRGADGWKQLGRYTMRRRKLVRSFSREKICGQSHCSTRIAVQVGMRYGRFWWNKKTSRWQRGFISLKHQIHQVKCGEIPADFPPGTLGAPSAAPVPMPRRSPRRQPVPAAPAEPPEPAPAQPKEPEPPPTVPRATFNSFLRSLRGISFDSKRLKMLRHWVSRLRGQKLRSRAIRRTLKIFSFDSKRRKAARVLAPHLLKPYRARDVLRIIRTFSHDSYRYKAALYYCKGVEDSLNVHVIGRAFSFASYKKKIMANCR